jgi:hypothetical protein
VGSFRRRRNGENSAKLAFLHVEVTQPTRLSRIAKDADTREKKRKTKEEYIVLSKFFSGKSRDAHESGLGRGNHRL